MDMGWLRQNFACSCQTVPSKSKTLILVPHSSPQDRSSQHRSSQNKIKQAGAELCPAQNMLKKKLAQLLNQAL